MVELMLNTWPTDVSIHTIFIKEVGGDPLGFRLPVNPERLKNSGKGSWADRDIIGKGEVSYPLFTKLESIRFDSFFPRNYDPTICAIPPDGVFTPREYVRLLRRLQHARKVVQLIITESEIDGFYTIRDFEWELVGGEVEDIYYSIEFKEYSQGAIRTFSGTLVPTEPGGIKNIPGYPPNSIIPENSTVSGIEQGSSGRPPDNVMTNLSVVIEDNETTLFILAQRYYGHGEQWVKIYSANPAIFNNKPDPDTWNEKDSVSIANKPLPYLSHIIIPISLIVPKVP